MQVARQSTSQGNLRGSCVNHVTGWPASRLSGMADGKPRGSGIAWSGVDRGSLRQRRGLGLQTHVPGSSRVGLLRPAYGAQGRPVPLPAPEPNANEKPTGDAAVQKSYYIPYAYTFHIHRADRGLIGRKVGVRKQRCRRGRRDSSIIKHRAAGARFRSLWYFCAEFAGCPENFRSEKRKPCFPGSPNRHRPAANRQRAVLYPGGWITPITGSDC
jgi:hypothetical protein